MKFAIKNSVVLLLSSLLLFGCGQSEPVEEEHAQEEEAHGAHEEEGGDEDVVELNAVQLAAAELEHGSLDSVNVSAFVTANGTLDLPPQKLAAISAPVDGFVQQARYLVGDYVKKGTVLAVLENMDYVKFQEDYQNVLSNLDYLEAEYQRQRRLDSAQVSSKSSSRRPLMPMRMPEHARKPLKSNCATWASRRNPWQEGIFPALFLFGLL